MSIAIDGFEILQRLGKHAEVFAVVRADVDKQARALVVKCLKAKAVGLDAVCAIHRALGGDQFGLVIEGLKDAEVKSMLTRLDKHHPELKGSTAAWRRQHLTALADGSAKSIPAPAKAAKKTAQKKPRLESETMAVYRAGGKKKG